MINYQEEKLLPTKPSQEEKEYENERQPPCAERQTKETCMNATPIVDHEEILENFLVKEKSKFLPVELYSETVEGCAKELFGYLVKSDIRVVDDKSYKEATFLYNKARTWKKFIEDCRKRITEPYRKKTASINDKAKELTSILDTFIDDANRKTCSYLQLLEEQRLKKEAELKSKVSLLDLEEDSVAPVQSIVPAGDGAIMVTKRTTKFRVIDEAKVPSQYLMVNEEAIQHAIKLGMLEIPGIEIYEETTSSLRKTS
jgi:hypothetical protein